MGCPFHFDHLIATLHNMPMKIATFNVNNINRRLPYLLQWLKTAKPIKEYRADLDVFSLSL